MRSGARQLRLVAENNLCSILFHLDVPGGRWQTVICRPVSVANSASSVFHNRNREPLDPPASAVITNLVAVGYVPAPMVHHRRIDSTANAPVLASVPTLTQPVFAAMSYTPYGATFPNCLSTKSWTLVFVGSPSGSHSRAAPAVSCERTRSDRAVNAAGRHPDQAGDAQGRARAAPQTRTAIARQPQKGRVVRQEMLFRSWLCTGDRLSVNVAGPIIGDCC